MKPTTRLCHAADPIRDAKVIKEAAELLRAGELVVFPTETVYGLGANALCPRAVERIFTAKGRPQDNPLIVHIAELAQLAEFTTGFSTAAMLLAGRFWPGPLTMILPKSPALPPIVSAGLSTVAVRLPSHPVALALLREAGIPVAAPSANRSGSPSPTTARHCLEDLAGRVAMILDGGDCPVGVESTVISLTGPVPRLLRPGLVTLEELREVLGVVEADPAVAGQAAQGVPAASPGMKYKHYAPRASLVLVHGELPEYAAFVQSRPEDRVWGLVFREDREKLDFPTIDYGSSRDPKEQARLLFSALRALDDIGAGTVYVRAPKPEGVGLAVYNRLLRAAGFVEVGKAEPKDRKVNTEEEF